MSLRMETLLKLIEILAGLVGPVLVVVVTTRMNHTLKENARIKELEEEAKAKEKKDLDDRLTKLEESIAKLGEKLEKLEETINDLDSTDGKFDKRFKDLAKQQKLNARYTHELAQLVITIAAGMRDQHLDGNVTNAIDQYHKFEQGILNEFVVNGANLVEDRVG